MFRLWPWARWTTMALLALTSKPRVATAARPAPWTGTGSLRRDAPSNKIHAPAASSSRALTWAAITSARANPKLCRVLTGRAVRIRAPTAIPRPATSETRWAASASNANDPNTIPPATSTTSRAVLTPNAQPNARR